MTAAKFTPAQQEILQRKLAPTTPSPSLIVLPTASEIADMGRLGLRAPERKKALPPINEEVSVTRSFSLKVNLGNYQSADFFSSQTVRCRASEAEEVSPKVYEFCRRQVRQSIADFKSEREEQ